MFWLMVVRGESAFKFVRAEAPCWKGEIVIPVFSWRIVVGWQRDRISVNHS